MQVDDLIDRLAAFEPTGYPFVSLYLDARPDEHGRTRFDAFVRKELPARARTYPERSPERQSLERDIDRILAWLATETRAAANGIALFACDGADHFFEAVQLDAPLDASELHVGPRPHLYPLARLNDRYRHYAVVVTDTHLARILVFSLGEVEAAQTIISDKMRRSAGGGWSQARFQRHVDNFQAQHVKEVVEALEKVVREDNIGRVVLAGDEVVVPLVGPTSARR
jgi:peptide chain release factor subunit 1